MQEFNESRSQKDVAQTQITPAQLFEALKIIEAQQTAPVETLTIQEAIRDLSLEVTPEQILAAIHAQMPNDTSGASQREWSTARRRPLHFLFKPRRRLGVVAAITVVLAIPAALTASRLLQATRQSDFQSQAFIQAVRTGDLDFASGLLDQGVDPNTRGISTNNLTLWGKVVDPLHGRTPALTIATARGDTRMVDLLLNKGADPNIQDYLGSTPLFYLAGRRGYTAADQADLHLLVQHGARIGFVDYRGETPRHYAEAVNNQPALVRDLTVGVIGTK